MSSKAFAVLAASLFLSALSFTPPFASGAQASGCDAGAKIDRSSADSAKKAMTKAGYLQIHDLKKGCDNFWHGQAIKDGQAVRIVLSPKGQVDTEGN
jgi:hypothetical protein